MEVWMDCRDPSISNDIGDRWNDSDAVLAETSTLPSEAKPGIISRNGILSVRDRTFGIVIDISTVEGQDEGLSAVGSVEWILAECKASEWRMIPAENLIAAARSGGTKLAFVVDRGQDVVGLSRALELGVDALCIRSDAKESLWQAALDARKERRNAVEASLPVLATPREPTVERGICYRQDQPAVLADRVCLDLVQMLGTEEGCWIGSSAKLLALVLSEAAEASLVPSRPFRVNAGPVHSYVLLGDGKTTKYLCELQAGDELAVYNSLTGETRPVAVGRLKVEMRPCMIVGIETERGDISQLFLQQAETVRIGAPEGGVMSVTDLETAEWPSSILLRSSGSGTHIGRSYDGKVVEK